MSATVNEAFVAFNKEYVNLDPERTKDARGSRDWLMTQLESLPTISDDFPALYNGMHIRFGSFARNTKIPELDDIDLILAFTAAGTTYNHIVGGGYSLHVPESATELRKLCDPNGVLNSTRLINKVVGALKKIPQYKKSDLHKDNEAAVLDLNSVEWKFDIVPAFYTNTDHYVIPDRYGNWKPTDPRVDQKRINEINKKHGGKVLQLIRTLKFWNRRGAMTNIPSYLFENIILNYYESQTAIHEYIDFNLRDFFAYLYSGIHKNVPDPKKFQGELNTLSYNEREGIAAKASASYYKAKDAIDLETVQLNQPAAIKKWAEIFGPQFN